MFNGKPHLWLTIFICTPFIVVAQLPKIDSIKALISKESKPVSKLTAYWLTEIGGAFAARGAQDSAIKYYYSALQTQKADSNNLASIYNGIGAMYGRKGLLDSSILYHHTALGLYQALQDTASATSIEANLAISYKNIGSFPQSLKYAFAALRKIENGPPSRELASCYSTMASVYGSLKNYKAMIDYNRKALYVRRAINYEKGVAQSYNNIGQAYYQDGQYDSAITNLRQAISIKRKLGDQNSIATTLTIIGQVNIRLRRLEEAKQNLTEALSIKRKSSEKVEMAFALNELGRIEILQGNYDAADKLLTEAENTVRGTGALDPLSTTVELKLVLYKKWKKYAQALSYAQELLIVRDSLLNKEKAQSLLAMQISFETDKKEKEIKFLRQDKLIQLAEVRTSYLWIYCLVIIVGLVLVILGLLFLSYRNSLKNKAKVENLLKELHHRVKNNLQILSSILSLQSQFVQDKHAIQAIKSSESRVNTMAIIHKKLYLDEVHRSVNMKEYCTELIQYLVFMYGFSEREMKIVFPLKDLYLDVDKAIPIGLILNELVSNSLKYAFRISDQPELAVSIVQLNDHELSMEISDNGTGISTGTTSTESSFGLKMVDSLVRELRGEVSMRSVHGTSYFLKIPL